MAPCTNIPESALDQIHEAMRGLEPPKDLFSGLALKNAFAPDNILFFRRTHTSDFRPEGVSNNFHHRFELVIVIRKEGPARIGNHSHVLTPGEGILIFPNQFHHYMDVEEGDLEWLFITFELGNAELIETLRDRPRIFDKETLELLESIIRCQGRMENGGADHILEISFDLSRILMNMVSLPVIPGNRRNIHGTDDVRDVILERINSIVRENLDRQITIADLAEETGYSVSYLRAIFRDRLGASLGKYIRESRLSRAAQLLQSGRMRVTEVAGKTGFDSLFAFSRAFKNAYGVSPKAYSKLVNRKG
ncbi:MAG: AraC family transcriptional regulator [Oceanipulchritudo sp.]